MPVGTGMIGTEIVSVLRDTGCSGAVIKKKFVKENQFTGKSGFMLLADNTLKRAPFAKLHVKTPFYRGEIEALCLDDCVYDLIIGNLPGAVIPDHKLFDKSVENLKVQVSNLDAPQEDKNCITATSEEIKVKESKTSPGNNKKRPKPSKNNHELSDLFIDKQKLIEEQNLDTSLLKIRGEAKNNTGHFKIINGILYRENFDNEANDDPDRIVVPTKLRNKILKLAHEARMGGHLGRKKTKHRISTHFFWPGLTADVKIFCETCDECQKTVQKGNVPKAPLGSMSIIDVPFKRVGIDIIGPIYPGTLEGHRYLLTLVDYATRYPEAVPLKNIDVGSVADGLISIFSRLGIPEEILTDNGTQFISECMKEVFELLQIDHLITSISHPMCNGLCESFNKTLKNMLRKMCKNEPKTWNKFVEPLLFAYREVPQESTGFSPFELMFGRPVRGPLLLLSELWKGKHRLGLQEYLRICP